METVYAVQKERKKKEHLPLRVCHQNVPFQFPNGREGQGHTMSQITLHSKVETAPKKKSPLKKNPKNFNASQHYHQCNYFAQRRQNVFFVSKNSSKSAAYPPCFLLLFVFMLSAAATGGCKDRVLSGSGLRSVLAPSPPQPNSKTHHL